MGANITDLIENIQWEKYNGSPPKAISELAKKYEVEICTICHDEFCPALDATECILACGHFFHTDCLRKWEITQMSGGSFAFYQCPTCKATYPWRMKWEYHRITKQTENQHKIFYF